MGEWAKGEGLKSVPECGESAVNLLQTRYWLRYVECSGPSPFKSEILLSAESQGGSVLVAEIRGDENEKIYQTKELSGWHTLIEELLSVFPLHPLIPYSHSLHDSKSRRRRVGYGRKLHCLAVRGNTQTMFAQRRLLESVSVRCTRESQWLRIFGMALCWMRIAALDS